MGIELDVNTVLLGVITLTTGVGIPMFVRLGAKIDGLCERISKLEGKFEESHC